MGLSKHQILLVGLIAALGSAITVVRRHVMLTVDPWRYETIAAIVHALLIPVFLSLASPTCVRLDLHSSTTWWAVLAAILNISCAVAFSWSLRGEVQVGIVSMLTSLSPVLTLILAVVFLGETPSIRQLMGIGLALCGILLAVSK